MQPIMLIYDIESDRKRTKIAETCKDYGLDRIQYSAFVGQLSRNYAEELMLEIDAILDSERGDVQLIIMPQNTWDERMVVQYAG